MTVLGFVLFLASGIVVLDHLELGIVLFVTGAFLAVKGMIKKS